MDGNLYGTTWGGGAGGRGTVFQLTPSGILTVLYSFTGGSDGRWPAANLFVDAAANLYGTTASAAPERAALGDAAQCSSWRRRRVSPAVKRGET
jgi:uncharacterized repeat protein (TIGR03803 family)